MIAEKNSYLLFSNFTEMSDVIKIFIAHFFFSEHLRNLLIQECFKEIAYDPKAK